MKLKFSYKIKTALAILSGVFAILIFYRFVFSKTIAVYEQNKLLSDKVEQVNDALLNLKSTKMRLDYIDDKIGNVKLDSLEVQQNILHKVSAIVEKNPLVKIEEFSSPNSWIENGIKTEVTTIIMKSDFKNLLIFLNELESSQDIGKVISAKFAMKKTGNNSKSLFLTVYLQNVKSV